ncbi:cob(I)yrinic acid a,c-diamide adenosyltransferase [bacterium]|nr:cob(I)yrinic acid a,c-diamide adenosyltransferase [bacterium]
MAKFSITTKRGDEGLTSLYSGERVPKDDPRPDTYGDVDELESVLGIARLHARMDSTRETLLWLQRSMFPISSEIATTAKKLDKLPVRVDEAFVAEMDARRDALEERIEMPKGFVVTGGTLCSAHLDHARTVARRCERKITRLVRDGLLENRHVLVWFNRLSDFLWLLAREEGGDPTMAKE